MQAIALFQLLLLAIFARANPITIPSPKSVQTPSIAPSLPTTTSSATTLSPAHALKFSTAPTAPVLLPDATSTGLRPEVTAPPGVDRQLEGETDMVGLDMKFRQTTYWSCVAWTHTTHCGWHEPILDAGAARIGCPGAQMAVRAGVVAGLVGGIVLGA
ncbi:uncharacterized protein BCR38DRAFT_406965 [Pseudomassariella vexata]|uniref:Uncharacterized protein n=1 Tax=Pseudomassariella vexata TaxID=1141098 RepID=A0A1Y2EBZ1_9PEZI|nr:uncharacterized protein BCR38DRAFT_406965 [Pseudomassariella vexata]ORY69099.1 hypothetical protein BCR38DRAFT_406965 [Pseudomassariella vexata]